MKLNRSQFLKILGLAVISPVIKACEAFFGVPRDIPSTSPAVSSPQKETRITLTGAPTSPTEPPTQIQNQVAGEFFCLHPFIEAHPEAVFIKLTDIPSKTDKQAKQSLGCEFAREILIRGTTSGTPLTHKVAIKANVTYTEGMGGTPAGMGIITDVDFTEGFIEGLKELGFLANRVYLREGNWLKDGYCSNDLPVTGYVEMAERTGIHAHTFPDGRRIATLTLESLREGTEVVWKECPNGVVFQRIGYMAPFNLADSWLVNIAKFKTHSMGMTLCTKNLQGTCVSPYVRFCEGVDRTLQYPQHILADFQPDFPDRIARLHAQHVRAGFPRWDRPGRNFKSGFGMEAWAQRTCDSHAITDIGLNVIEGIYGRNGNGFMKGPGADGNAEDFMTNLLIFGKDAFRVDIIGTWLAGHEPGNFGLFHIAQERGLCNVVNPREIPIYLWDKNKPLATSLSNFERTPLLTPYLVRDYNSQTEAEYHLVDEFFDYSSL